MFLIGFILSLVVPEKEFQKSKPVQTSEVRFFFKKKISSRSKYKGEHFQFLPQDGTGGKICQQPWTSLYWKRRDWRVSPETVCEGTSVDSWRLSMAGPLCTLVLVLVVLVSMATGGMDSCYDAQGRAQRCMPMFENAAFGREVQVTNTCGSPPEDYCLQMGTWDASSLCHRCDAADDALSHNATYLTDFHSQGEATWWQSQSMAFGIQHPNSVNLTLHLGKCKPGVAGPQLETSFGGGAPASQPRTVVSSRCRY